MRKTGLGFTIFGLVFGTVLFFVRRSAWYITASADSLSEPAQLTEAAFWACVITFGVGLLVLLLSLFKRSTEEEPYEEEEQTPEEYDEPYSDPYSEPYADTYSDPYSEPHADTYPDPYSEPYAEPYSEPYADPYPEAYHEHHREVYDIDPWRETDYAVFSDPVPSPAPAELKYGKNFEKRSADSRPFEDAWIPDPPSSSWENPGDLSEETRRVPELSGTKSDTGWICEICGCRNPEFSGLCAVCGSARGSTLH